MTAPARSLGVALAASLLLSGLHGLRAQGCAPPVNDNCAGALAFTFDQLPLSHAGLLGCDNFMVDRPYFDVFFRYDCTLTGTYQFDMCGSVGDSYMRIYTGGCGFGPASSWVEDDDGCGFAPILDPLITLTLQAGTSYWIELGAWREDMVFPPNANDAYSFQVAFLGGGPGPWTGLGGGTLGAAGPVTLTASGPLTSGSNVGLELSNTPPGALTLLWLSTSSTPLDVFGGTIHALPLVEQFVLGTDGSGELSLATTWPPGVLPGTEVWFQFLVGDPSVVWGITLSNAVLGATP